MLKLINENLVNSVHDVSNGGLIISLCEMSMVNRIGVKVEKPKKLTNLFEYFFGEDQGRYVLEIDNQQISKVEKILKLNNIYYEKIGHTQKKYFEIDGELKVDINDLFKINNNWYNSY